MDDDTTIPKLKDNLIDFEEHRSTISGMLKNAEAGFCVVMNTDYSITGYWSFSNLSALGKMQMLGRLNIMQKQLRDAYVEEDMETLTDEVFPA